MNQKLKGLTVLLTILTSACLFDIEPTIEEAHRVASPDGQMDAVVLKLNFGATTPFVYRFYLVAAGQSPDISQGLQFLVSDQFQGTSIRWADDAALEIRCLPGRIYEWHNMPSVQQSTVRIEIDSKCPA